MASGEKVFCALAAFVLALLAGLLLLGAHANMLRHSCNLYGMQHSYDSAHIAQICGK